MFNFIFYRCYIKYIYFFLCFCTVQINYANENSSCSQAFLPSSINHFVEAMTKNVHLSRNHDALFRLYQINGFGNPNHETHGYTFQNAFDFIEQHPELSKMPMQEQIIKFETQFAERDENLNKLLKKLKSLHLNKMRNLFQIEDHLNFWNHILAFRKPASSTGLTKTQRKELKTKHHQEFLPYLDAFIDKDTRKFILDTSHHYRSKVITLYKALKKAREKLKKSNKNIHPLSQAMIDLTAGTGFLNEYYLHLLNSSNAVTALKGLKKILKERETTAILLGFRGGFSELKESLGISTMNQNDFQGLLFEDLEDAILNRGRQIENTGNLTEKIQTFRLRALSLQESPFRSCLGGDCTTSNYFELGLYPNFLFFTLTDDQHRSSGQITIVLGHVKDRKERSIKTAVVDNIHNIPPEKIHPMLEGIRLSLSEYGYRLALPNREDLSNEQVIRNYVVSEISPNLKFTLKFFKPHKDQFPINKYYINYDNTIGTLEFDGSSIQNDSNFTITPGQKHFTEKIHEDLNLRHFMKDFLDLRLSGKQEHQMKFLNNLPLFMPSELEFQEFQLIKNYLLTLLEQGSFAVKKHSLYALIQLPSTIISLNDLDVYLKYFTEKERKSILDEMSAWKTDTHNKYDEYKERFMHKIHTHIASFNGNLNQLKENLISRKYWRLLDMNFIFESMLKEGNLDIIIFFIEEVGIDINNPKKLYLHNAGEYNIRAVKTLLEHGVDVNAKDSTGTAPLHWAVIFGHTSRVKLFLEYGADVNAETSKGLKPFDLAAEKGHTDIARILAEHGAI